MHRNARRPLGGASALLLSALVVLVAACGPSRGGGTAQPVAPARPKAPAYLVYAGNLELGRLQVLAADGLRRTLPAGVASPDWRTLYVAVAGRDRTTIEAVDAASGRVQRSLEVAGRFRLPSIGIAGVPDGISAKRKSTETSMAGYPNMRVTDPGGTWVYTLYRNPEHGPFVHALNAQDGYAFCLDLPRRGRQDERLARLWALVRDQTGTRLYAVDTALGLVTEIDGAQSTVLRSATFPPQRPGAGGQPVAGSAALSPDGSLLLAGGGQGVVAIDTRSLEVTGRYLGGWTVDGLVASSDGRRLYALSRSRGQLATLDPSSGAVLGQQPAPDATLLLRATGPGP
jgi:DNA-binding beta-propeller fold protein YncE